MSERCAICGCVLNRTRGAYASPNVLGRSHATAHHYVAERFFGRTKNRKGECRDRIFPICPWGLEGATGTYCYECHEELLHNPVLLPEDIERFARLVDGRKLCEAKKPKHRRKLAGRIELMHEVLAAGIAALMEKQSLAALSECGDSLPRYEPFDVKLRSLCRNIAGDQWEQLRPFVCRGELHKCKAMLVGVNPATSSCSFWDYWDGTTFDYVDWLKNYKATRKAAGSRRQSESPTRRRLRLIVDRLQEAGIPAVETNRYWYPAPGRSSIPTWATDDRGLQFLLDELRPPVVLVFDPHFDLDYHSGRVINSPCHLAARGAGRTDEFFVRLAEEVIASLNDASRMG